MTLIFENVLHSQNNRESEQILLDRSDDLTGQCAKLRRLFQAGARLTVRDAMLNHNIGDLRRRVKDLRDNKEHPLNIKSEMIGKGFKVYFL